MSYDSEKASQERYVACGMFDETEIHVGRHCCPVEIADKQA